MEKLLQRIIEECRTYIQNGKVATYIPELAKADSNEFGICTISFDQGTNGFGDYEKSFTMQSIVKAIILLRALEDKGEYEVRNLVGVEATGKPFDAFNYSDQALKSEHINPMINAGAIALCTLIDGETYQEKFQRLLDLTRKISGNPNLIVDEDVFKSEYFGCHQCINTSSLRIKTKDVFEKFLPAVHHEAIVVDMPWPAEE